jgi:hypothetical protein
MAKEYTKAECMAEYNKLSEKEKAYWDGYADCLNENCK